MADSLMKVLLCGMVKNEASDLHIKTNRPPIYRIQGTLVETDLPPLNEEDLIVIIDEIMNEQQKEHFLRTKESDFAFSMENVGRFRTNAFFHSYNMSTCLRVNVIDYGGLRG